MPPADRAHPTLDDPVVAALSESVGGPVGERATRHPWWTPLRVILALTALTFALGMVQKSQCYLTSWQDGELRYSSMCYSDLPYLYTGRGFAELTWKEGALLLPFIGLIVFCGVYPKPMLDRVQPSVDKLLAHVEAHSDYRVPSPAEPVIVEGESETHEGEG